MKRVAAFTGAFNEPCARFRVRQHIENLKEFGVEVDDLSSSLGTFPPRNKFIRPIWAAGNILQHIPYTIKSWKYDVSLIQREFLSTFYTVEFLTRKPRILDVDDAIWIYRGGKCARKLAESVNHIICGNQYLAEWFQKINTNITIIPTAVDTERFAPTFDHQIPEKKIIGWTSTSSSYPHLYKIEDALLKVFQIYPNCVLRIISDQPPSFKKIPEKNVEYIKWTPEMETKALFDIAIGIMPLEDNEFSRGKCSYKMLTYMSCEKPVVVSPVGMNKDVLSMGKVGFSAENNKDWTEALLCLLENDSERAAMGKSGRQIILSKFDKKVVCQQISEVINYY